MDKAGLLGFYLTLKNEIGKCNKKE